EQLGRVAARAARREPVAPTRSRCRSIPGHRIGEHVTGLRAPECLAEVIRDSADFRPTRVSPRIRWLSADQRAGQLLAALAWEKVSVARQELLQGFLAPATALGLTDAADFKNFCIDPARLDRVVPERFKPSSPRRRHVVADRSACRN